MVPLSEVLWNCHVGEKREDLVVLVRLVDIKLYFPLLLWKIQVRRLGESWPKHSKSMQSAPHITLSLLTAVFFLSVVCWGVHTSPKALPFQKAGCIAYFGVSVEMLRNSSFNAIRWNYSQSKASDNCGFPCKRAISVAGVDGYRAAGLENLWRAMLLQGLGLNFADFGASLRKLRGENICVTQEATTVFGLTTICGWSGFQLRDVHWGLYSAEL